MEAPGTRLYVDFVWRRLERVYTLTLYGGAWNAPIYVDSVWRLLERVYTLTLYGGTPPRRFRCERAFTLIESKTFHLNVSANESAGSDRVANGSLPNYQTNDLLKRRELKELIPGEEPFCPCLVSMYLNK